MRSSYGFLICALFVTSVSAQEGTKDLFVSKSHGFSIQAPVSNSSESYQVVTFTLPPDQGFAGNVNVQRQKFSESIEAYDIITASQFKEAGITVLKKERRNGEILYEYAGKFQGVNLHWYSRAIFSSSYVYLVTATALESSWTSQREALIVSVESFMKP